MRLSAFKGRPVVLSFDTKEDTPGCTVEACGFRNAPAAFGRHKAVVLRGSPDSARSRLKFRIDAAGRIARAFTSVKPQEYERDVLAALE